ncbi:unnamed protein product [Caenorhabditis auriculariae]|uniref:Uncharacterized protein n=1 Tax=Caenorhabditis auriculariae TaxID=2777116 RepID=A0A8S1HV09_9PELO|nr:unnamed protein product [Caenorhabditis auriculariae]
MAEGKRRRYTQGRSRTIELSTLPEIDEDAHVRQDSGLDRRRGLSQDDSCVGSAASRSFRGSVRSIVRHLSERQLAQRVAPLATSNEPSESQKEASAAEEDVTKKRQYTKELQGKKPERKEATCAVPRHPISRSASFVTPTPMIVYGLPPDRISMVDPRELSTTAPSSRMGEYAVPVYYTTLGHPPPPPPIYLPMGGAMLRPGLLPHHPKFPDQQKDDGDSVCGKICCGGVAQLLWTIICIILFGVVASLILALCYI